MSGWYIRQSGVDAMADQTLEPFCAGMDEKCGTGHCGAMTRKVLARWGCACVESVENGGDEIRRYGGLLYTRWLGGAFVEYVDVAEGTAAFAGGSVEEKRGEGRVPCYTHYYQTKEVCQNMANGDTGMVTTIDKKNGLRYNYYVDCYNSGDEGWGQSDCDNNLLDEIEKPDRNPYGYAENPNWQVDFNNIMAEYRKHKKELDDLEYNYLGGQRTGLEAQIKEAKDQGTMERLTTVQKQVEARMEKMRPTLTPTEKSSGLFGWFSTTDNRLNTTDVCVLLDELRQLNVGEEWESV
jgi:hypothetical protein